jgi:hypothetical protein
MLAGKGGWQEQGRVHRLTLYSRASRCAIAIAKKTVAFGRAQTDFALVLSVAAHLDLGRNEPHRVSRRPVGLSQTGLA